uniref:Amine oxidase domain-containing protein n=1 Tax=Rhizochromulina marina TaxID=1034831 RepID=A0A7S2S239_9STRA|mmetsp:Transcript_2401/g.6992  ORF Transcript_2401/g.6992 Transcript_2401/m.6992 type:complete len:164 (+) Transcript_2401:77-568(+)
MPLMSGVVGGRMSGLSAVHWLGSVGVPTTVPEAQGRVGGHTLNVHFEASDCGLDLGLELTAQHKEGVFSFEDGAGQVHRIEGGPRNCADAQRFSAGAAGLAQELVSGLPPVVQVRLEAPVEGLGLSLGDGVAQDRVQVRLASGDKLEANAIVLALPPRGSQRR